MRIGIGAMAEGSASRYRTTLFRPRLSQSLSLQYQLLPAPGTNRWTAYVDIVHFTRYPIDMGMLTLSTRALTVHRSCVKAGRDLLVRLAVTVRKEIERTKKVY